MTFTIRQQTFRSRETPGRWALALVAAPATAALAAFAARLIFLWAYARPPYLLWSVEQGASAWIPEFLGAMFYGSIAAAVVELAVLPFFLLFRRLGWLNLAVFLAGAAIIAVALESVVNERDAPRLAAIALFLLPSLAGALTFGYVGGWLAGSRSAPAFLTSATRREVS